MATHFARAKNSYGKIHKGAWNEPGLDCADSPRPPSQFQRYGAFEKLLRARVGRSRSGYDRCVALIGLRPIPRVCGSC